MNSDFRKSEYLKKFKSDIRLRRLTLLFVGCLMYVLLAVITFSLQYFIDYGSKGEFDKIVGILPIMIGVIVAYTATFFCQYYMWKNLIHYAYTYLQRSAFSNILNKDYMFFLNNNAGELYSKLSSDLHMFSQYMSIHDLMIIINSFRLIAVIVPIFIISKKLTFITLLIIPLYYFIYLFVNKKVREYTEKERVEFANVSINIKEKLDSYEIVQTSNKEEYFSNKFNAVANKYYKAVKKVNLIETCSAVMTGSLLIVLPMLFLLYGFTMVSNNEISLGQLFAFYAFIPFMIEPLTNLTNTHIAGATGETIFKRVENIIKPPVKTNLSGIENISTIAFNNVGLEFGEHKVLQGVNYEFSEGDRVAIVGKTGSGKSSFLRLLLKLYTPTNGGIKVNDINLQDIDKKYYLNCISYMPQTPFIFEDTIRNNITLGDDYTDDEILKILDKCQLSEFIENQTDGLDTLFSEQGKGLSGGEKQRISLARTLIKNRDVLVLDEPTSAIDDHSENKIIEILDAYLLENPKKIFITITHRKKIIEICDKQMKLVVNEN